MFALAQVDHLLLVADLKQVQRDEDDVARWRFAHIVKRDGHF